MKKLIYPMIVLLFVAFSANANPRFKNKKHFKKDFDPTAEVEAPLTTLAELNKGPQYKNQGHVHDATNGSVVDLNNANTIKGPGYKNQKHFKSANGTKPETQPELAGNE